MRAAAPAVLVALLLAGCGGGGGGATAPAATTSRAVVRPPAPPAVHGVRTQDLGGGGQDGVFVARPEAAGDRRLPVVVFLHGYFAINPTTYGPWIEHLARAGNEVIYPIYQQAPFASPATSLADAAAGIRRALASDAPRVSRTGWVAVGHSAGGALAADLTAAAPRLGVPRPVAVLSAYPGRRLRGIPLSIPEGDLAQVPGRTRVVVLGGAHDQTVGTAPARRIAARTGGRYVLVTDPAVDDHLGPQRSGRASRRVFWRRLDLLIRAAR